MDKSEVIHHRGLEINTASHKVCANGKEVQFTAKEYFDTLWSAKY